MLPTERVRRNLIWTALLVLTVLAVLLQKWKPEDAGALHAPSDGSFVEADATDEHADEHADEHTDEHTDEQPHEDGAVAFAPPAKESELLGKVVVALHDLAPTASPDGLLLNAERLRDGPFVERVGYAILVGEVKGWSAAIEELDGIPLPEEELDAARALRAEVRVVMEARAQAAGDGPWTGDSAVADAMRPSLGVFADVLGGTAAAEATTTMLALIAAGIWYIAVFLAGLVSILVLAVLGATGRLGPRFASAGSTHASLVLGETFLVWMVLFVLLQIVAALVAEPFIDLFGPDAGLLLSVAAMAGSLLALLYPALRGISGRELRASIGLHSGRGVLRESLAGLHCYITAVPLLAIGLVVFAILSALAEFLQGPTEPPSHPVVELFSSPSPLRIALLFLLASVAAPIVEEIAFRGLLYGHLRGTVAPRIRLLSMLVAAVASSVVFAIIHPQGVLFVPALGGLAVGFCIFRELRGSLVAPMVAHGVNNAVTLSIGLTLMS